MFSASAESGLDGELTDALPSRSSEEMTFDTTIFNWDNDWVFCVDPKRNTYIKIRNAKRAFYRSPLFYVETLDAYAVLLPSTKVVSLAEFNPIYVKVTKYSLSNDVRGALLWPRCILRVTRESSKEENLFVKSKLILLLGESMLNQEVEEKGFSNPLFESDSDEGFGSFESPTTQF